MSSCKRSGRGWVGVVARGHAGVVALAVAAPAAGAVSIDLTTGGATGLALDGIGDVPDTVSVAEAPGLTVTARAQAGGSLNAVSDGFGVGGGAAIDSGEAVYLAFNREVSITGLDFRDFAGGEGFVVSRLQSGVLPVVIGRSDLTNQGTLFWDAALSDPTGSNANRLGSIPAGEVIELTVLGAADSIVLQSIVLTVVPEPAGLAALGLGGVLALRRRRA